MTDFTSAMNEDLNIAEGLAVVFDWVRETNRKIDSENLSPQEGAEALGALRKIDSVLSLLSSDEVKMTDEERALVKEREAARESKNWSRSDEIREIFQSRGYELEDTPRGTVVKKIHSPTAGN